MKKVAVVLSGCGSMDGAEIREAVFALLALEEEGAEYKCFSLNKPQAFVCNHLTKENTAAESRNMLAESARISRGRVRDLSELKIDDFDALLFVGGYGNAVSFSNFLEVKNPDFQVEPLVSSAITAFHGAKKPICFLCVSPILGARVLGKGLKITLGAEGEITQAFRGAGLEVEAKTENTPTVDVANKVVTVPCYMLSEIGMPELRKGIAEAVKELAKL